MIPPAQMILFVFVALLGCLLSVFLVFPLFLAALYSLRLHLSGRDAAFQTSRLFVGRVWHTRFQPKRHSFTYPIFMFALDLEEMTESSKKFLLGPLVQFQECDHLKNGEGERVNEKTNPDSIIGPGSGTDIGTSCTVGRTTSTTRSSSPLVQRILRLVAERTDGKCKPSLETHRVILLTHLTYFGYNFNPVSFYYIIDKDTNDLAAMVGEVSNTPWLEMYPYVLHPDSQDKVQSSSTENKFEYSFPKTFHVSPFMEMDYFYDWSFTGLPSRDTSLTIINSLRRRISKDYPRTAEATPSKPRLAFTAKLIVEAKQITPIAVAVQMIRFPIFCLIIQIWIHYQAAWLFLKGMVYVPHPQGSETTASKTIATIMSPFFALRDRVKPATAMSTQTKTHVKDKSE